MKQLLKLCLLVGVVTIFGTNLSAQQKSMPSAGAKNSEINGQINKIEELVDRYFISLNDPDDKRRRDLIKQIWSEKGKFLVVPVVMGEVEGLEAVDQVTKGGITNFPGATVRRTSKVDGSGNYYRWNFTLSKADGRPIASGVDFATIVDGKLQSVIGFLDFY